MGNRCIACGRYPFCSKIENPSQENNCDGFIKRRVGYGEVNKICEFPTGKTNSKGTWWKKNTK